MIDIRDSDDVGVLLSRARVSLGLTQEAVAAALNTSPSYICRIESGRANPTLRFVRMLRLAYIDYSLSRKFRTRAQYETSLRGKA